MNENQHNLPDEDASLGPPVAELTTLAEAPPDTEGLSRLLRSVRGRINRRQLTASALDVSLLGLFKTFFEFLKLFIQAFAGGEGRAKER